MNKEELQKAMNEAWQHANDNPPDVILCAPLEPYQGNWKRFFCKLLGHKWEAFTLLNATQCCDRCLSLIVVPMETVPLQPQSFSWWNI